MSEPTREWTQQEIERVVLDVIKGVLVYVQLNNTSEADPLARLAAEVKKQIYWTDTKGQVPAS